MQAVITNSFWTLAVRIVNGPVGMNYWDELSQGGEYAFLAAIADNNRDNAGVWFYCGCYLEINIYSRDTQLPCRHYRWIDGFAGLGVSQTNQI